MRFRVRIPMYFLILALCASSVTPGLSGHSEARLVVKGDVDQPLSFSMDDLHRMPRTILKVTNPHEGKTEVYEGVALEELLRRAGVPQGSQLRGPAMATYVQADAADGYRVVFSIAELDADLQNSEVIVADTMDGGPLAEKIGPFRLVVPHDKRPARWVRMLQSITVVRVPNSAQEH